MTVAAVRPAFTADHEAFRDSVRRFIGSEVTPHLATWREAGGPPREVLAAAGAHGFLGTAAPEQFGGGEADDYGFLAVLIEETVDAGATGLALLWALHAGVCLMRGWSNFLAKEGIRVNTVHPTGVNSPMIANEAFARFVQEYPEIAAILQNPLPVHDGLLEPEDVTNSIVHLISDAGQFITGTEFRVDAGFSSRA